MTLVPGLNPTYEEATEALYDPHCETEKWWRLAEWYPIEAIGTPLHGIFLLESPQRWQEMETRSRRNWVHHYQPRLSWRLQRRTLYAFLAHGIQSYLSPRRQVKYREPLRALKHWSQGRLSPLLYARRVSFGRGLDRTITMGEDMILRRIERPWRGLWYQISDGLALLAIDAVKRAEGEDFNSELSAIQQAENQEYSWQWNMILTMITQEIARQENSDVS